MDKLKICKCRSCGAPIVWITTKNGKAMPCDAKPRNYLAGSKDVFITEDGKTVLGTLPEPGMMQPQGYVGWGYVPHYATCPHADEHRKKMAEFANDIFKCGIALDGTDFAFGVDGDSHFDRLAKSLYGIGYRKCTDSEIMALDQLRKDGAIILFDVRRETAKEILSRIANHIPAFQYETLSEAQRNLVTNEDWLNAYLLKELAREYGVEVEE